MQRHSKNITKHNNLHCLEKQRDVYTKYMRVLPGSLLKALHGQTEYILTVE